MGLTDELLQFDWDGVSKAKQAKMEDLFQDIRLSDQQLQRMRSVFLSEMDTGLAEKSGESSSSLLMENTFLPELPNSQEAGEYLALDLGGTNFRVMYTRLLDGAAVEEKAEHYSIDESTRLGEGTRLFDCLAGCVEDFIRKKGLVGRPFDLGFTFSFPMIQKSLDVGLLQTWTKSFNASGCVGKDAVGMLNDALRRRPDINVNVVAILNDTTGTLVQGASQDPRCVIGMILGTGSNAAYIEQIDRVKKWEGDHVGVREVAIDIEWGAFGDTGVLDFLKTDIDREVDGLSLLVHSFTFEKYFAGKYLGEVLRQCVLRAHRHGLLFETLSESIQTGSNLTAKHVSMLEKSTLDGRLQHCEKMLQELHQSYSSEDLVVLRYLAASISVRGAVMVSACLSVILERVKREDSGIAVDGSLFKLHPRFPALLEKAIAELAPGRKFHLFLSEDGSGKGAAMVAAVAHRLRNRSS